VILPVFKTGARRLCGVAGAFDSHTLPPISLPFWQRIFLAKDPWLRSGFRQRLARVLTRFALVEGYAIPTLRPLKE